MTDQKTLADWKHWTRSQERAEIRALGWRTFWGIVTMFLAVTTPIFLLDLDTPQFEKLYAHVGVSVLFIAWVAVCTQVSKRLWRL